MLTALPTAAITVMMLVTATKIRIRSFSPLQHKKQTNTKREEIKGRENYH